MKNKIISQKERNTLSIIKPSIELFEFSEQLRFI